MSSGIIKSCNNLMNMSFWTWVVPVSDRVIHYNGVIMGAIASQITSLTIVYSIVYSDADQRKHQSSASLSFVRGIHRGPVNSPHKWPVTRKMFPFDDIIMMKYYDFMKWKHFAYCWLLALCVGNSTVTGEFPFQRPVTRSFDVFFDLRLSKQLNKQSRRRWFETPSHSLWRHCNDHAKCQQSSMLGFLEIDCRILYL